MTGLVVTRTGAALALVTLSFFALRGTLNLLNAVAVPLILYTALYPLMGRHIVLAGSGFLLWTLLFFRVQLVFALVYLGLFTALVISRHWALLPRGALLWVLAFTGFLTAIYATQWLWGIPLVSITRALAGGTQAGLVGLIGLQSLLPAVVLPLLAEFFDRRLQHLSRT